VSWGLLLYAEVSHVPVELDELWSIAQAVEHLSRCGLRVKPVTVRQWIYRGHLPVAERDDQGRPKVRPLDVARAEYATRALARRAVPQRAA
jgi:hypothetical protein